jgi:hypothetical protein
MLKLDESHPLNRGVLNQLREKRGGEDPVSPAAGHPDPYLQAGSHPDIVTRVWDTLGGILPADCRAMVYGTPALVHPKNGVVLALAYGTSYVIRIPVGFVEEALEGGCEIEKTWAVGGGTNLRETFGSGWLFGGWEKEEADWLSGSYNNLSGATQTSEEPE